MAKHTNRNIFTPVAFAAEIVYLNEICRRDQFGVPVHLIPERELLLRDVPEPQDPVQAGAEKELVVLGVERQRSDEIDMLEAAETLPA